jgi:sec-independent protein translocase protein TatA
MAFDDPIVWVLIIAVVVFLFGSSKIPQFARSIGQARKEFDQGFKGISNEIMAPGSAQSQAQQSMANPTSLATVAPSLQANQPVAQPSSDPLITACRNEGIDTTGKTKEQLASELAWKLNKK